MKKLTFSAGLILLSFSVFAQKTSAPALNPQKKITVALSLQSWSDLLSGVTLSSQIASSNDYTTNGQMKIITKAYGIMNDSVVVQIKKIIGQIEPPTQPTDTTKKH